MVASRKVLWGIMVMAIVVAGKGHMQNHCQGAAPQSTSFAPTGELDSTQSAAQSSSAAVNWQTKIVALKDAVVAKVKPGIITFKLSDQRTITCKVQTSQQQGVTVGGVVVDAPVMAIVRGQLPLRLAEKGMVLKCSARLNLNGKIERPVLRFEHLHQQIPLTQPHVEFFQRPQTNEDFADCEIVGRVIAVNHDVVSIEVPQAKWARRSKIKIPIDPQSHFRIRQMHLKNLQPGDQVDSLEVRELENGERLIKSIRATFNPQRSQLTIGINDRLAQEFAHLPKIAVPPRILRSDHFVLHTDMSQHQSMVLLAKLENLYRLVGNYYSQRPTVPIQICVVDDLVRWDRRQLPPAAIAKILERTGVTVITNSPGQSTAVVYSCNDDRIVQHESVHAFCVQAFGGLGPVWYAEGVAELGLYFNADAEGVQIDPVVVDYLKSSPPKTVAEIITQPQSSGDTWQQYAWRWAVCHFLSVNQNYARRFKNLGVRLMSDSTAANPATIEANANGGEANGVEQFNRTFARQRRQLDFEFAHFLNHLDNGVRAKAMRIQWDRTPKPLQGNQVANETLKSDRGWQVVGVAASSGQSFDLALQGKWRTSIAPALVSPKIQVCILGKSGNQYEMSPPQRFSGNYRFAAPIDGQIMFRCDEGFEQIHDNEGQVEVFVRLSQDRLESP